MWRTKTLRSFIEGVVVGALIDRATEQPGVTHENKKAF
jgi:hypothetical protein